MHPFLLVSALSTSSVRGVQVTCNDRGLPDEVDAHHQVDPGDVNDCDEAEFERGKVETGEHGAGVLDDDKENNHCGEDVVVVCERAGPGCHEVEHEVDDRGAPPSVVSVEA